MTQKPKKVNTHTPLWMKASTILAIMGLVVLGAWENSLDTRQDSTERLVDPCVKLIHADACKARTCIRLEDVGAKLPPPCKGLLARVESGHLRLPQPESLTEEEQDNPGGSAPDDGDAPKSPGGAAPPDGGSPPPGGGRNGDGGGGGDRPGNAVDITVDLPPLPLSPPAVCAPPLAGVNC